MLLLFFLKILQIRVYLKKDKKVKIEKSELRSKLLAIKKERESDEIYLRASKDIEYQNVAAILALVSNIGYSQISLVTDVE